MMFLTDFGLHFYAHFASNNNPLKQARGTTGEPSFPLTGSTKMSLKPTLDQLMAVTHYQRATCPDTEEPNQGTGRTSRIQAESHRLAA